MENINEQVLMSIQLLKRDPKRLIDGFDYDLFHAYIEGYVDGLNLALDCNLRGEITRFFEAKGNIKTNYYWTNQIRHRNKNGTNSALVEILLRTTEEYFLENNNWYQKTDQTKLEKDLPVWFKGFKNYTGMFIEDRLSLPLYLEAFVDGLNVYSSKNLRLEISHWFCQKTKQEPSFHWTDQMIAHFADQYEEKFKKLIEATEEFFKTNKVF